MNHQEASFLAHHGVKGMKWGVRRDKNRVRKSFETRTFERLAKSGAKRARTQDALYNATKNPYNKKSADQWRKESADNKKKAEESYRYDVLKSKTSRKDRLSKRQIRKDLKKIDGKKMERLTKLDKEFSAEVLKTKEGKAYQNTVKNLAALEKAARDRGGVMTYTQEQATTINKTFSDFNKKGREIYKSKYQEKAASAYLKDLGYKDTEYGRAYLKRHGFV